VLPARHRLAARKSVSVTDLANEAWIVPHADGPAGGYRGMLERLCADAGFAPELFRDRGTAQAADYGAVTAQVPRLWTCPAATELV
jgi:hypothetical protein